MVQERAPDIATIDMERAAREASELLRAAQLSHRAMARALGSHRLRAQATVEVRDTDRVLDALQVTTALHYRDDGEFRAVVENSHDYGREVIYTGGQMYLAPRYGKFHRRPPEVPEEPERLRDQFVAELAGHFEILAANVALRSAGDAEYVGRKVRKVAIELADSSADAPSRASSSPSHRAWRDTARVLAATGEIWLDRESGIVLRGAVRGKVAVQREGGELLVSVDVTQHVEGIGEPIEIAPPPADRVAATPLRSAETDQRETLLRGIAPPIRRGSSAAGQPPPGKRGKKRTAKKSLTRRASPPSSPRSDAAKAAAKQGGSQ